MSLFNNQSSISLPFGIYHKYLKWLLFTGVIAVFPIGLDYMFREMSSHPVSFIEILGQGQLMLISCALCASGLGEIISSVRNNDENVIERLLTGFAGLVFFLLSSAGYGYISASMTMKTFQFNMSILIPIEVFTFSVSFVIGLFAQKFS